MTLLDWDAAGYFQPVVDVESFDIGDYVDVPVDVEDVVHPDELVCHPHFARNGLLMRRREVHGRIFFLHLQSCQDLRNRLCCEPLDGGGLADESDAEQEGIEQVAALRSRPSSSRFAR